MKHKFSLSLESQKPLKIVGVLNALIAKMAKEAGFEAIYLSGASLSSSLGLPDLGMLSKEQIVEESRKITLACDLPLLVDIDTGWDNLLTLERACEELLQVNVSAVQIEDQTVNKRCGHREGKRLIDTGEMCDKLGVIDELFVVARCDALAVESLDETIKRSNAYFEAGADMVFVEAVTSLDQVKTLKNELEGPLLLNLTEFGKTPPFKPEELAGIAALLYPMSVNRMMYASAARALSALQEGKQEELIDQMMRRDELYKLLAYEEKENRL